MPQELGLVGDEHKSEDISQQDLLSLMSSLDETSDIMSEIAVNLSNSCTSALDEYINYIATALRRPQTISNDELDDFILNLPIYIYYASAAVENLGIREDVATIAKKRKISEITEDMLKKKIGGTASSRTATAEAICTKDVLVNDIYSTAYKSAKAKLTYAYEVLASCKKVLSRRIEELKAFNSDTNRNNPNFNNNQS